MPQISFDEELENEFIAKLQEKCAPVRKEIHVSDLSYCLRKAYWRRFQNRKLTIQQLIFFLDGHQRHQGLQELVKNVEHEVEIRRLGVVGHLDLLDKMPIEIKTTRGRPNGQKPAHYLRQGAYYCLLTGSDVFQLITQYINDNVISFEKIKFSKEELDTYLKEMLTDRDLLQRACDKKDVAILPFLNNWQCRHCEFYQPCRTHSNGASADLGLGNRQEKHNEAFGKRQVPLSLSTSNVPSFKVPNTFASQTSQANAKRPEKEERKI